jgi:hypothetical protein
MVKRKRVAVFVRRLRRCLAGGSLSGVGVGVMREGGLNDCGSGGLVGSGFPVGGVGGWVVGMMRLSGGFLGPWMV